MQVNLHDAKTHLSRYVEQALDGEDVVIALAGKALVRLVPIAETPRRRHLGFLQGSAQLSTDLKAGFNAEIDSTSLGKAGFAVDASQLRQGLLREGFQELGIEAEHCLAVQHLPWVHRDPFDRLLVAQAISSERTLLTADRTLERYGPAVHWVGGKEN